MKKNEPVAIPIPTVAKGELRLYAARHVIDSPKKRTDDFLFFDIKHPSFVFFGESMLRAHCFWLKLNFSTLFNANKSALTYKRTND